MEADYAAAPIDIGFNARYARDMLDAFDGDTLTTQLADAGSPAVFTGAGDAGFLCVLMPMRV
jgi:DNA polymerase-3 subunit beta